jgi:hypothetical protein
MVDAAELSDLQLAVIRILWTRGEASAAEVQAALQDERPIVADAGPDLWLALHAVQVIAFAALAIWAFFRLDRVVGVAAKRYQ